MLKKLVIFILIVTIFSLMSTFVVTPKVIKGEFTILLARMLLYGVNGIAIWELLVKRK